MIDIGPNLKEVIEALATTAAIAVVLWLVN